jgi:hypothetical protein
MATIIRTNEVITEAQLAARVPVGTIVRFTYAPWRNGAYSATEVIVCRGRVTRVEGESLHVVNTHHGEDPWMVGKTQMWSARFCTVVRRPRAGG